MMTPEEIIEKAKVGDTIHIRDEANTNAAGKDVKIIGIEVFVAADPVFLVELTGQINLSGGQIGFILTHAHIDELNAPGCSGYDELNKRVLAKEKVYARWYGAGWFDNIIPGDSRERSGKCSGYKPAIKDEKTEQYQKDVEFFFKDLAQEWVSPKKNGFEFL